MKTTDNDDIKSEIIYALGYKIKDLKDLSENRIINIINEIKVFIDEDIKSHAKSFLDI